MLLLLAGCGREAEAPVSGSGPSVYGIQAVNAKGKQMDLAQYKGKVMLVVNVASECGYTPQYEGLQQLYGTYKEKGLEILAFPSNDFAQEKGSIEEIKQFCTLNYGVTFDLFDKIHVKGEGVHPLYRLLTENASPAGEVEWNFEKFLLDREGKVVARYKSSVEPAELKADIEKLLK
ncbi:glutathione peroxidase [Ectobacillus ponti]|nr:glutathione peroxidase [Ectobacillus ponti]